MSLETYSEPPEEVFGSWFIEIGGEGKKIKVMDPTAMPPGLYAIVQAYLDQCALAQTEEQRDLAYEAAAPLFKETTGFELNDFLQFRTSLNEKK